MFDVKLAMFGLGRIGKIHFQNAVEHAHVKYIVEGMVEEASEFINKRQMKECSIIRPEERSKVFEDQDIQAVLVCTPSFTHGQIIREAVSHGKAVFSEKPLAVTIEEIQECYAIAENKNVLLYCSFNRRFHEGYTKMHKYLESGQLGRLYRLCSISRDPGGVPVEYLKVSGGMFLDCAIHDIDLLCWMAGEKPESVFTQTHCHNEEYKQIEGEFDTAEILFKFPSGAMATISVSRNACYGHEQYVDVFGSKGLIRSENQRKDSLIYEMAGATEIAPVNSSFVEIYAPAYEKSLVHFLTCLTKGEQLIVTGDEVVAVAKIIKACEQANASKQPDKIDW